MSIQKKGRRPLFSRHATEEPSFYTVGPDQHSYVNRSLSEINEETEKSKEDEEGQHQEQDAGETEESTVKYALLLSQPNLLGQKWRITNLIICHTKRGVKNA